MAFALVLVAFVARADELPANSCSTAGADCLMDDGSPGTCIEERHEYVDEDGSTKAWTEKICVPAVSSAQRAVVPWIGLGLAFLALCAALATRPKMRSLTPTLSPRERG
ncbi:MAG: hypothetical protein JNM17_17365 [Archangium sp.]|nr:hypothetical protein [Archangium sp.]